MRELLTTDEFANWFRGLDDPAAEEVAVAIELIASLGSERTVPHSSELLLWYQDLGPVDSRWGLSFDAYLEFSRRVHGLLAHLQSPFVQGRLRELPLERATLASAAISALHAQVRGQRLYRLGVEKDPDAPERAWAEARRHYAAALEAIGLSERPVPAHSSALRQLELRKQEPGSRILYGVDVPRQRALLVLGEPLDRRAYGPSVRRALSVWQRFLVADEVEGLGRASARRSDR